MPPQAPTFQRAAAPPPDQVDYHRIQEALAQAKMTIKGLTTEKNLMQDGYNKLQAQHNNTMEEYERVRQELQDLRSRGQQLTARGTPARGTPGRLTSPTALRSKGHEENQVRLICKGSVLSALAERLISTKGYNYMTHDANCISSGMFCPSIVSSCWQLLELSPHGLIRQPPKPCFMSTGRSIMHSANAIGAPAASSTLSMPLCECCALGAVWPQRELTQTNNCLFCAIAMLPLAMHGFRFQRRAMSILQPEKKHVRSHFCQHCGS